MEFGAVYLGLVANTVIARGQFGVQCVRVIVFGVGCIVVLVVSAADGPG